MDISALRIDGRFPNEIRSTEYTFKKIGNRGVIYWRQGNSIVQTYICASNDKQQLVVNLNFLETSRNEATNERYIYEMKQKIGNIFSELMGSDNQIEINIDILGDDGSILSVIINSISLACAYSGINLIDMCISTTLNDCLDLSFKEEFRPFSLCLAYCPNINKILHFECFGKFQKREFEESLKKGIEICKIQHENFREMMQKISS